jgi:DNA polymerase-3 subunit beta
MRLSISQSELLNALTIVSKGLAQRASLPIISGIYIETRGDEVSFQTTDLEMSVQYTSSALIEEPGSTVLPGKLFIDIVKNLPDAAVHPTAAAVWTAITAVTSSWHKYLVHGLPDCQLFWMVLPATEAEPAVSDYVCKPFRAAKTKVL